MATLDLKPIEVYMPEYCVQGERIPFYLLWDKSKNLQITISLPDGLELKEAYNIDAKDIQIKNGEVIVHNFETGGYFGGVISSKLYEDPSTIKTVKFSLSNESDETYQKHIELFRPDVRISDNVSTIHVKLDKNNRPMSNSQIPLMNDGKGTGIIKIKILDESEIKEGTPEGFEGFRIKFLEDMNKGLTELQSKFLHYSELLESFKSVVLDPLPSDPKKLENVRDITQRLEEAFDNSEEFFLDFMHCAVTAYLKNISIMTDVNAFLAFMRSVGKNKLIFVDAVKVLKISSIPKTLSAELIITDLAQNKYPAIKLPKISISADKDCTIPIYQILKPSGD